MGNKWAKLNTIDLPNLSDKSGYNIKLKNNKVIISDEHVMITGNIHTRELYSFQCYCSEPLKYTFGNRINEIPCSIKLKFKKSGEIIGRIKEFGFNRKFHLHYTSRSHIPESAEQYRQHRLQLCRVNDYSSYDANNMNLRFHLSIDLYGMDDVICDKLAKYFTNAIIICCSIWNHCLPNDTETDK